VKLILLELNELAPDLMTQFIEAGDLPNFRRLRQESTLYTTDAGEDPPNLEPWIQWITVHTGVPFSEHRVFHLGDADEKLRYPGIGRIVFRLGGFCRYLRQYECGLRGAARLCCPRPMEQRPAIRIRHGLRVTTTS